MLNACTIISFDSILILKAFQAHKKIIGYSVSEPENGSLRDRCPII